MVERFLNINSARLEIVDHLLTYGRHGVLWPLPVMTDEDTKSLLAEVRASGWRVKRRYLRDGDAWRDKWEITVATDWRSRLTTLAEMPAPSEVARLVIPNPGQADEECRVRNADLLVQKRNELRQFLLGNGGIREEFDEERFFPVVVMSSLMKELRNAGWIASNRSWRQIEVCPSLNWTDSINSEQYLAQPLENRLPTPQEANRHALLLHAAKLKQVRREVTNMLRDKCSQGPVRHQIDTRDWPGVVKHWVATRLRQAGWTVNGEAAVRRYSRTYLEIKPAVHAHIKGAAVAKYFPMPDYDTTKTIAATLAAARARVALMLRENGGQAILPDDMFAVDVRDTIIAELTSKPWKCRREGDSYLISAA